MRLVTIDNGAQGTAGVVVGDDILDIAASTSVLSQAAHLPTTVRGIIEGGDTTLSAVKNLAQQAEASREQLVAANALHALAGASLLAPIPNPSQIVSCGMNFKQHLMEMGGGLPKQPQAFLKSVNAIVGPDANIVLPKTHPNMVDWEAEFCGVIGKTCHQVSADEALDYVMGYTMVNDVSARDWVKPMAELKGMEAIVAMDLNILGKQFPTFCPMGPSIVTKDELTDPANASFELTLNGEVKQSACTDDLLFSLADLIAYYSQWYVFEPGDVITTGCPAGVGMGEKPFRFLQAGDVVTISAAGIGSMTNTVVAAP